MIQCTQASSLGAYLTAEEAICVDGFFVYTLFAGELEEPDIIRVTYDNVWYSDSAASFFEKQKICESNSPSTD